MSKATQLYLWRNSQSGGSAWLFLATTKQVDSVSLGIENSAHLHSPLLRCQTQMWQHLQSTRSWKALGRFWVALYLMIIATCSICSGRSWFCNRSQNTHLELGFLVNVTLLYIKFWGTRSALNTKQCVVVVFKYKREILKNRVGLQNKLFYGTNRPVGLQVWKEAEDAGLRLLRGKGD